jgi:ectoine hydroxylase-related dioxygenase (phytanoyl-CoA dioxygenase family)
VSLRELFLERGWVRVDGAFSADAAAAIRSVTWDAIEKQTSMRRDDASTWTFEWPDHLDHLKGRPEMKAVGTDRLRTAIADLLGSDDWTAGKGWGANFVVMPTTRPFDVASGTWHVDWAYDAPLDPVPAVQVISLYGDVEPRAGGMQIIEGSHRVVAAYAAANELPAKHAKRRQAIMRSHPWLVALNEAASAEDRVQRFMIDGGDVDGVPVRVVECAGAAGDVYLIHPLVFHCRPTNAGAQPRFMLSTFARLRTVAA